MKYSLDGKDYDVVIVRKSNKNTYVRVKDNLTIYVTTSYFTTKKQIIDLLDNNHKFLEKNLNKKQNKKDNSEYLSYLGDNYYIVISNLMDDIQFIGNKVFTPSREYLDKWLDKRIKTLFKERYIFYYNNFDENIPLYKLKFRKMKTRWGVCNKNSEKITLNTRLIEYESFCLDYVIVHELRHLLEFNHSSNFWKIVEKYFPKYKTAKKILKD